MKFSLGDAVFLKPTAAEGIITDFISKTIYEVEVEGTRFPVFADELEHPYLRRFTAARPVQKPPAEAPIPATETRKIVRAPQGCSLAFLPEWKTVLGQDELELVKIHLLNETPDSLRFHYELRTAGRLEIFSLTGTIPPFGNVFLHHIPWEQMAAQPRFHWELQPTFQGRTGPSQSGTVHLRPRQLIQRLQHLDETGAPLFSELLVDGFLTVAEPLKLPTHFVLSGASLIMPQPAAPTVAPYLDLHANVLIGDTGGMQPSEIFRIQLDAVQDYLQMALSHGLYEVLIVHGVGTGSLRRAVQELAGSNRGVKKLIEEWHPRWGFGATKVKLKRG